MKLTITEENYLKCIYHLSDENDLVVQTNAIAHELEFKAASVTEMIKKLAAKDLLEHVPYKGVRMLPAGRKKAIQIIRRHRLWECFLCDVLKFSWDEIHEIAEQLEHIDHPELVDRLDKLMNYPLQDPHGAPIPNADGEIRQLDSIKLSESTGSSTPKSVQSI